MKTGNINGCVLIAKNNKWQKYTDRALETIKYYNLPIKPCFASRILGFHLATGNQLEFYYRVCTQ
jgi:hypothetical protein